MNILKFLFYFGIISGAFACSCLFRHHGCHSRILKRSLVVGAEVTSIKEFPFAGTIYEPRKCGCTIISKNYVLTAAHCVFHPDTKRQIPVSEFKLHFGSDCRDDKGITTGVNAVRVHCNYDKVSHDYDIALMILSDPLGFHENVKSVKIASANDAFVPGLDAWIVGWETTHQNEEQLECLKSTKISLLNRYECQSNYNSKGLTLTINMICAENFKKKVVAYQG